LLSDGESNRTKLFVLQKELWISRALSHKNILVHESAFVEEMMLYVVTEFMDYGKCTTGI